MALVLRLLFGRASQGPVALAHRRIANRGLARKSGLLMREEMIRCLICPEDLWTHALLPTTNAWGRVVIAECARGARSGGSSMVPEILNAWLWQARLSIRTAGARAFAA